MRFPAFRPKRLLLAAFAATSLALAGCEGTVDDSVYYEGPVDELYNIAMDALLEERYKWAAKLFDEVERQHPYSVWATKAKLMSAYALYQADDYDAANQALDRFISLHPGNRDVDYAYYLQALTYYERITDVERDQAMTEQALASLEEVMRRFPDSTYARDARRKYDFVRDHLAGKEMAVGRWYLNRGQYVAAINRFRTVVDKFQTTTHVPEALHRLVEAYTALGITDEARKAASVLGYNYPDSEWYQDSYELVEGEVLPRESGEEKKEEGFLARAWGAIF